MPKSIDATDLINSALQEVRKDPKHRLDPRLRQKLYDAIEAEYEMNSVSVFGRLGCLSARRALPRFEAKFPDDLAPREILNVAEAVVAGQADETDARDRLDMGHHASGNAWGYDESELPASAWLAANAAYHSLVEALGTRPLRSLTNHHKAGQVVPWTDEDLCWLGIADTASVACMAISSSGMDANPDPSRMLSFWTWWLTEALQIAIHEMKDRAEDSAA